MTHEKIEKVIHWLNSGDHPERVFAVPLVGNIAIGMVWPDTLDQSNSLKGHRVFFLTGPDGEYIAAIVDMGHDIHAVTLPEHRRKGLMFAALNDVVLPFLAAEGRTEQRMTLQPWNAASSALVERLTKTHSIIKKFATDHEIVVFLQLVPRDDVQGTFTKKLTMEASKRIKRRIFHARNLVRAARDELLFHCHEDDAALDDFELLDNELATLCEDLYDIKSRQEKESGRAE